MAAEAAFPAEPHSPGPPDSPREAGAAALRARLGALAAAGVLAFAAQAAAWAAGAAPPAPALKARPAATGDAKKKTEKQAGKKGASPARSPAASVAKRTPASGARTAARKAPDRTSRAAAAARPAAAAPGAIPLRGADRAEARLIEVYTLWGRGQSAQALARARELVRDQPNFQAAQLMYADLLSVRLAPAGRRRAQQELEGADARGALGELRTEQQQRLQALLHRPPAGAVPSQLLAVPRASRYALAVDVSRSRLYVLRNTLQGLVLEQDFYVSVGKAGAGKQAEGDARTPLGVYHITSNLSPKGLRDFYGAGALPINYPNPFDQRVGRTGSGIWLHGVPPEQYARAPQATDGCVVLADNDLRQLIRMTDVGATAVVIAQRLDWMPAAQAAAQAQSLRQQVLAWRDARAQGDLARWQAFYLPDAVRGGRLGRQHPGLREEMDRVRTQPPVELKDVSVLRWKDRQELMVVSFGEVAQGARTGAVRRQYWLLVDQHWKIFHEEWI